MRKFSVSLFLLLLCASQGISMAQEKRHTIMFYNVENLFDTIRDTRVRDSEFTPEGSKAWNGDKYKKKLKNLEEVIYKLSGENRAFPVIIGVAEVENRNVLEDLVSMPKLLPANYQISHFESPDARGVDVAMFYRPDIFKYEGSEALPVDIEDLPAFKTRDVLLTWGRIDGEPFYIFVNHWPSRSGGEVASRYLRVAAAQVVKDKVADIQRRVPEAKIIIMGDMNDDPVDKSMAEVLDAKEKAQQVQKGGLFNPFYEMYKKGFGTLAYQGQWNLFDNIIVNDNLLRATEGYRLDKGKFKYYGFIFDRAFLRTKKGEYKDYPFRTFSGDTFLNGYSDHFPVYIHISK